jgi:serine acetyltransferase
MKQILLKLWQIEGHIRAHIRYTQAIGSVPLIGRYLAMLLDRLMLIIYGIDLDSRSIRIFKLSISHPSGVLLGGNGIVSKGRVAILPNVKFVAHSPLDPVYLKRHMQGNVFDLGDNVVIGTGTTVIGPVTICDDVIIGAMSLVNKDITEPGTYVGIPAKKLSKQVSQQWVEHL